jgi:organic radical activating enzyme
VAVAEPARRSVISGEKILAVMPTRTCTAACRHCGSFSGPHTLETLDRSIIRDTIAQAAALDFYLVAFTGGEATLAWDALIEGLQLTRAHGMKSRLVTNGHWASSVEEAAKVVRDLREAGLDEFNISTGDEHVRFVSLDHVARAIIAALEQAYDVHVMVEYRRERLVTKDTLLSHPLLEKRGDREKIAVVESPWMPLSPRRVGRYRDGDTVDGVNVHLRGACTSVLQSYTLHPDGALSACCGLGMELIPELYTVHNSGESFLADAIADAEGDLIKLWLRYKGPEKILQWASERDPSIRWQGMYAHNCQACQRVYRDPKVAAAIRAGADEAIAEVLESVVFDEAVYPAVIRRDTSPA